MGGPLLFYVVAASFKNSNNILAWRMEGIIFAVGKWGGSSFPFVWGFEIYCSFIGWNEIFGWILLFFDFQRIIGLRSAFFC